ncbi:MAG: hypothetical protein C4582_04375 [Desulfobacteraceae bacterium]|nr:MAG: hypothetical protein C4582_04375 [Desulfobacteraceae bacterium]
MRKASRFAAQVRLQLVSGLQQPPTGLIGWPGGFAFTETVNLNGNTPGTAFFRETSRRKWDQRHQDV